MSFGKTAAIKNWPFVVPIRIVFAEATLIPSQLNEE